jgi:hypothetical protein
VLQRTAILFEILTDMAGWSAGRAFGVLIRGSYCVTVTPVLLMLIVIPPKIPYASTKALRPGCNPRKSKSNVGAAQYLGPGNYLLFARLPRLAKPGFKHPEKPGDVGYSAIVTPLLLGAWQIYDFRGYREPGAAL